MDFQQWADIMLAEGATQVAARQDRDGSSDPGKRYEYHKGDSALHHYRTVLDNEICFDLGDHGDWLRTIRETHALWLALNRMNIPYWGALSGGRGTHTHVFGPRFANDGLPIPGDWRNAASGIILDIANEFFTLLAGDPAAQIEADYRLLAPTAETRLVREFGARKTMDAAAPKSLWVVGPGPFLPLPRTSAKAYEVAKGWSSVYPKTETLECIWLPTLDRSWMAVTCPYVGPCPQGPHCNPGHKDYTPGFMRGCAVCPFPEALEA